METKNWTKQNSNLTWLKHYHSAGKTVALFGCWGWGEGEFMRKWEQRVKDAGATLFEEGFTNLETPGDEELENAKSFGSRFAQV